MTIRDMQQFSLWPRTIQANIYRFHQRIIAPAMRNTPVHEEIVTGVAPSMDVLLDRAAAQVDNYTANEANKVYALVLIALFERYVRLWAGRLLEGTGIETRHGDFMVLLDKAAATADIDLETAGLRATLYEALLVGNAVRHGDGKSLDKLKEQAGHLIDRSQHAYVDLVAQDTADSEWLRIQPSDIEQYVRAMIRFWGMADKLPLATTTM